MSRPTYELAERQSNEHRPGHLTLLIDGVETELTTDPAQFAEKAMREAVAKQGHSLADLHAAIDPRSPQFGQVPPLDPVKLAADSGEICRKLAEHALDRKAQRLQRGLLPTGAGLHGGPSGAEDAPSSGSEAQAVEMYLNRGRLKGLDASDRKKRKAERDAKRDHAADYAERRAKLLATREADLKQWLDELAKGNPKAPRMIGILEREIKRMKTALILNATHGFQYAYGQYATEGIQLATDDIRIVPVMTNTSADSERDAKDQVSDFSTLDEFDGSGYSTGGNALDNQAVNIDDANDRAEFDCDDVVRSSLGAGTRSIQAELVILFSGSLSASMPVHYIEYASNKTPDGSNFTVAINTEGLIQLADG